ncbi:extracellular serine-rich protein [Ophiostoma piceae UAMH 11346]|uniref:Extracellular serine-rich protein n=1 Tax=Ophiostoma piceae (strain UAMH 11346) TaxID=1262450 RepID=S3BSH3_OPHP1|nr:extracellular serine-rich protein [Ophiostoma piceae UAMH 11346]
MRLHTHTLVMASLAAQALGMNIGFNNHQNQKKDHDTDTRVATTPSATTATATTSTSSTSATTPTHTIAVGATGFTFTPNNLSVAVGTVVEFNFYPGNHSVARSAYKFPCIPYENTGPNLVGFFSGFQDTNVYSTDGPKYRILVNSTEPIFYYCSAPSSCMDHGMIGVINPNTTWTLETQEEYAANTTIQLSPGDPLPSEVAPSSTATSSASARGHNVGEIVGIAVGVVAAGLAALAIAGWCCVRRNPYLQRRLRERRQRTQNLSQHRTQNEDQDYDDSRGHGHSNPLSPMTPSTRQATPGSASSMFRKYGTSPPPPGIQNHRGLPPVMADMTEYLSQTNYRHRTPPPVPPMPPMPPMPQMAQISHQMPYAHIPYHLPHHQQQHHQQQHSQHYYPGLPVYSNMPHMSPLQSHPFYDKVYSPPPPVELPTAVALSTNVAVPARRTSSTRSHQREYVSNYTVNSGTQHSSSATEGRPPPPVLKESPTIGGAAGSSWDKTSDDSELRI